MTLSLANGSRDPGGQSLHSGGGGCGLDAEGAQGGAQSGGREELQVGTRGVLRRGQQHYLRLHCFLCHAPVYAMGSDLRKLEERR